MRALAAMVTAGDRLRIPVVPRRVPGVPRRGGARALALHSFVLGALAVAAVPRGAHAEPAPPRELLLNVAIGPEPTLRSFAAFVDAVKPGAGMAISSPMVRAGLASAAGASSLDGFDPASWSYLLVANLDGAPSLAVVSRVQDASQLSASAGAAKVLSKGGWAILGPAPMVDRVGAWVLATLPAQRAPAAMNATVYLPHVMANYKAQIEQARAQMQAMMSSFPMGTMGPLMASYFDGLMSVGTETEKAVITLETTPDLATLDLALLPRAGSRLAKFLAMQRPSTYALVERLPDTPAAMLFGGHLELGPYRQGMLEMMASIYGPTVTKEMLAGMDAIAKAMTGEMAMAARFGPGIGMNLTQLFGVTDTAAADRAFAAIFALFKDGKTVDMGIATTIKTNPGTVTHDGVAMRSYETSYDLSKVPEAQRKAMEAVVPKTATSAHVAVFDHLGLVAFAPNSRAEAERAIDAVRGKAPRFTAPPTVGQLLASSRARKDSMAVMVDVGAIMSGMAAVSGMPARAPTGPMPFVLTFGCADHNAHFRIAAPASSTRTAVNMSKP